MMHYKKGKNVEEELARENIPIDCLPANFLWMHVKGGTKVSNVIEFAKKSLDQGEHRHVVWSGSGGGVGKTISCVEILKRSHPIHQVTRLSNRKVEEYWDPQMEGLEKIVVTRQIPCIHILTSLDEIDESTLGYQNSKTKTKFWMDRLDKPKGPSQRNRNQQPGGSGENRKSKFRQGQGQGQSQNRKAKQNKEQAERENVSNIASKSDS